MKNISDWVANPSMLWIGRNWVILKDSGFGNPYLIGGKYNRDEVLRLYKLNCIPKISANQMMMQQLSKAKQICCACELNKSCHGDLLLLEIL